MDETTVPQPEEYKASEKDIAYLDEARKILTVEGYIPQSKIEAAQEYGMPIPKRFDSLGHGPHEALNNFMMLFTGAIKPDEEPAEELQGRSYAELFRDRDEIARELGLDIDELVAFSVRSRNAAPDSPDSLYYFYREVLPIFEELVRKKGYSVDALKM